MEDARKSSANDPEMAAETSPADSDDQKEVRIEESAPVRDYRFWAIMLGLCATSLLASVETTVIVTSLPTIVEKLQMGSSYIWVGNVFFLTSASVQPLFGQISNLFGRRHLTLFIVALYTFGSGICGGANSGAMLIAGRAIQGAGSGGINMIVDVIISDLVPLRERGKYIAIILLVYGVGTAVGPFLGGVIVEHTSWRWVFYINLPIGGLCLVLLYLFLRVKYDRQTSALAKLRRIDVVGNLTLMAATISVLIALTWAGPVYSWSSPHILAPLIIGLLGLVFFVFLEGSKFIAEPVIPLHLFQTRTAVIVYVNTFLNSMLVYWVYFFVPLYFQAVLLSSPSRSGVQILPLALVAIPGAALAAWVLSKWGRYKALHVGGFALQTTGLGLFALLDQNSSTAKWVLLQAFPAIGGGMLLNTQLPAFQACISEKDQAAATASWTFIRSFGSVWGIAIPGAIFNSYAKKFAAGLTGEGSDAVRNILSSGDAYASATKAFVLSLDVGLRDPVIEVFQEAIKRVFLIGVAVGGICFLLSFGEKEVVLRTELKTEFGLEDKKGTDSATGAEDASTKV